MNHDARNLHRLLKSEVRPRLAGVCRFIDSIPVRRHLAANRSLASAHVEDVRISTKDRNISDGPGVEEAIAYVAPRLASVLTLPHPAACGPHIVKLIIPWDTHAGRRAAAIERSYIAKGKIVQ